MTDKRISESKEFLNMQFVKITDCWPLHSPAKPPGFWFRKLQKE
jgi:hypothetical protein